jgi:hypothetical protein
MLTVSTWLWGDKFGIEDVAKLAAGVQRHLTQAHRFVCFSDRAFKLDGVEHGVLSDPWLTQIPGCYARLRMFDPLWQDAWFADRLVNIDLDTVITGPLDPLFDRREPFVIMQGGNASNPCPYNGALMMLRRGAHPQVWTEFSVEAASKVPFYEFPDDQGWLWHKSPDAAGWKCGPESGVYVFRKPGWPGYRRIGEGLPDDSLPRGARLVTFSGWRNPRKFQHLDWVRRNWTT